MKFKRVLRAIIIFLVLYLITGGILTLLLSSLFPGVFKISLAFVFVWPPTIYLLLIGQYGGNLIIGSLIYLALFAFLGWLSYFIEKKLFSKKSEQGVVK